MPQHGDMRVSIKNWDTGVKSAELQRFQSLGPYGVWMLTDEDNQAVVKVRYTKRGIRRAAEKISREYGDAPIVHNAQVMTELVWTDSGGPVKYSVDVSPEKCVRSLVRAITFGQEIYRLLVNREKHTQSDSDLLDWLSMLYAEYVLDFSEINDKDPFKDIKI